MGIQDTDRTLPSNRMVFELRRDGERYRQFQQDIEASMEHYGLSEAGRQAWRNMDTSGLARPGVQRYFVPKVSRLDKGGDYYHSHHDAASSYAAKMRIV